jgi:hypothetical protein
MSKCGLNPICRVTNWAKRKVEDTYATARNTVQAKFLLAVDQRADAGSLALAGQIDLMRAEALDDLATLREDLHGNVKSIWRFSEILSSVLTAWLVLVAIKSYLYVLATELYRSGGPLAVTFREDEFFGPESGFRQCDRFEIDAQFSEPLLTFQVGVNQARNIGYWYAWIAVLHRLRHWKWRMNKGTHLPPATMHFSLKTGQSGVIWQMLPNQEIVFIFANLFGFSENVELHSEFSPRLSTILFGKYFFPVARCRDRPGLLLLALGGRANRSESGEESKVVHVPPEQLLAFSSHARFQVAGRGTIMSVFKDGFSLSRLGDKGGKFVGRVLVGASDGELRFQGTIRFVKTFLSPF